MSNQVKNSLRIAFVGFLVFLSIFSYSATRISVSNGDWDNAATWSGGVVPTNGDSVRILAAHTVTVSNQKDYTSGSQMKFAILGTLKFVTGKKLQLPCNSYLFVYAGGQVVPGAGGGNSNYIEICNVTVWQAADGVFTGTGCIGCAILLPIELVKFDVINQENNIAINWATATEKNTDFYVIERSTDAINWSVVSSVKAAENSSYILYYEQSDEKPLYGVSYYRLSIVDKDLSISYSEIKSVERIKKDPYVVVFPNPSNGMVNIAYEAYTVTYEVFDVSGKKIVPFIKESLQNKISLDFSDIEKGIYFINIYTSENNQYVYNKVIIH